MNQLSASPLGKKTIYTDQYDPKIIFAICRDANRINIGVDIKKLPFIGVDIWNGFDFTWLDSKQEPHFGVLTIIVPCESPRLIESKSLKLYLFSFANTSFDSIDEIANIMQRDLSAAAGSEVQIILNETLNNFAVNLGGFRGNSLDILDAKYCENDVDSSLLQANHAHIVSEQLCSDLLKSNCLVTGKPDWGSIRITYTGPQIDHSTLLQYLISYRNHQGFHEQCIEHIYFDILNICKPSKLIVEGRYTRRGGLDINPIRANVTFDNNNIRLFRQ